VPESIPGFDPYATLGVSRDAPASVVVAAYRARIRRSHPDRSSDPGSSERSKRLNIARDWLLDPERRARYDAAHPKLPVPSARARQGRAIPRPRRERDWLRGRERIELEVFVARCAYLTRAESSRLLGAHRRRVGSQIETSARHADAIARELGRKPYVLKSARAAVAAMPRTHQSRPMAELAYWTALGLAIADVLPGEAALLSGPWRDAMEWSDSRARARQSLTSGLHRLILIVLIGGLTVFLGALTILGLVLLFGLLTG
jgi:hypothetical protein